MISLELGPERAVEAISQDAPEPSKRSRSQFDRWGVTPQDLLVLTAGILFATGIGPFIFSGWTPRMAALLAGLPLGVVLLVRLAWSRDKAAIAALAFLVWALVGGIAAGAPRQSLLGQVDGNTQSVLIFFGVFGFWALARTMSDRGRALVGPVLVAALGASAFVGVLQILFNIQGTVLAPAGGRASGLEGNAAYFSMTICGASAWCASMSESASSSRLRRFSLGAVAFFALAIGLSGTRGSVIALAVVCAAVWVRARNVRSLRVAIAVVVGLGTSIAVQRATQLATDTADRFAIVGTSGRTELWRAGMSGFADRPFLGWGVGRARPAIQHHLTADFVRLYQSDDIMSAWNDVHTVVIQMLVTVGLIGVLFLAVFVAMAFRKADFGLALAAVAISFNWLLQPSTLSSLAIAAVFLGASATRTAMSDAPGTPTRGWLRILTASSVAVGLTAALALVIADMNLRHAFRGGEQATVRSAAAWFGGDPFVMDYFVIDSYRSDVATDRAERTKLALREIAAEPDIPRWWNQLAMTQWQSGDLKGMRTSLERALALQPNHVRSWVQMTAYAKRVGDTKLEATARTHACDLGAPVCAPG
ncbi:MAG: O-Antigen ligase [Ilumatobacteraceae bacterium]